MIEAELLGVSSVIGEVFVIAVSPCGTRTFHWKKSRRLILHVGAPVNCKVCLRGDNMVKVKTLEIPVLDNLQYFYCLLSSVLPVVKQIHQEQCSEVELEKKLLGSNINLVRAKLNAEEQMCCNICRIHILDYHQHCANCSYDLCLHCCQELREELRDDSKSEMVENQPGISGQDKQSESKLVKASRPRLNLSDKYPDWKANSDGNIPCPPKDYEG